jgi:ATP-dependent exoDNAse (exonuclease V) beta subunit
MLKKQIKAGLAFLRALDDPQDNQAIFAHLSGPVCRVPVSDLRELLGRVRHGKLSLAEVLTRTDLTRAGEDLELDAEAGERARQALLDLERYRQTALLQGLAAAIQQFFAESGHSLA